MSVEEYKSRKEKGLVIKQEVEKAYYKVNLEFLKYAMARNGFLQERFDYGLHFLRSVLGYYYRITFLLLSSTSGY